MKNILKSIAAVALLSVSAYAGDLVNVSGASKAAVSGYDTVAFFTDSKPVNGSPFISAEYKGATYFFATEDTKSSSSRTRRNTRRSSVASAPSA